MNAPSQTTPVGWFYADAKPPTHTTGWDGMLWPEITGYRGDEAASGLPASFVSQLVQVQLAQNVAGSPTAELVAGSKNESVVGLAVKTHAVPSHKLGREAAETSPAVAVALGSDGTASARGTARLYLLLALVLVVAALIIGVVL